MNITGIIPARYASSRFPGKPLADIGGISMVMRVVQQARRCARLDEVVVATDDARIFDHVLSNGGKAVMTSPDHPSGTDRCLEALDLLGAPADAVINIQGDEPFVHPDQIATLCALMHRHDAEIATLAKKITDYDTLRDPNKVKVVFGHEGRAIYFSRFPVPYRKNVPEAEWLSAGSHYKHIGLYAYRTEVLRKICRLEPSPLELAESLEQLRWMEAGYRIHVALTDVETPAVDTPEDLQRALTWL
jgi:3-deoxy-manno-octulosonate cytidylyltransferase (CMP-KDO synthetase)